MTIRGTSNDDILSVVGYSGQSVSAGSGNDTVDGTSSTYMTIDGGAGNDTLSGMSGSKLYGGNGDDLFFANDGTVQIDGGAGWDRFDISAFTSYWGSPSSHTLSGLNSIDYASNAVTLQFSSGTNVRLNGVESLRLYNLYYYGNVYSTAQIGSLANGFGKPVFDGLLYGDHIAENAASGTKVGSIGLFRDPFNRPISYRLLNNAGGRFTIDSSGVISVAAGAVIDYEMSRTLGITVRMTNTMGISVDKNFSILVDNVSGSTLNGTAAADSLTGTIEEDWLSGGNGADTIFGGLGPDTLTGGAGSDLFVFAPRSGNDVITDFAVSGLEADRLQFDTRLFADWNALLNASQQVGADMVIRTSTTETLTLRNVNVSQLTASNVQFQAPVV